MTPLAYLRVSKATQDTKNQRLAILESLFLDSGVLCSNVVRESQRIFKAMEKEGLQGGEGDKSRGV